MSVMKTGVLSVPGADLHYQMQGTGPLLLLLQGGDGDADGTHDIVEHLAADFTVLTCDRRGLSRSKVHDAAAPVSLETHAGDAHHLLAALSAEPAYVTGTSLGALLGLELIARHPEQVRLLVAHEPPATELLPEADRARAAQDQVDLEETFARDGLAAAIRKFFTIVAANFDDREPGVELPRPKPERLANLQVFLTRDAPAVRRYRLNIPALKAVSTRIVPAAGKTSGEAFPRRCAAELASLLGAHLAELPGGHNGFVTHPRAFAAGLRDILLGPAGT